MAKRRSFKACRKCKALLEVKEEKCHICGSKELTDEWGGLLVILDHKNSVLAQKLEVRSEGRFTLKVR